MLEHPERPAGARRVRPRAGEWLVYLVVALAAGVVTAFGVPWWLTIPVALLVELVCGLGLRRR